MLKINAYILNHKPGDVIKTGDKNYEVFKNWADRRDKRSGLIVCEHIQSEKKDSPSQKTYKEDREEVEEENQEEN